MSNHYQEFVYTRESQAAPQGKRKFGGEMGKAWGRAFGTTQARVQKGDYGAKVELARSHYIDFVEHTFPTYKTDPFHRSVANALDKVVTGEITHLMIFAPPQHGKSELVSIRYPSYFLARTKDLPVLLVSYGASLARRNSRAARQVFEADQYREVFPQMRKSNVDWRMDDWHVKNHKGYVFSAGVGGPITGRGFGLAVIDDPIQNWAAAQSETIREATWLWYLGTFKTRMWENSRTIFMMTRWHEDDLAARILKSEGDIDKGGKWKVLSYSALSEQHDPEKGTRPDPLGRKPGLPLAPQRFSKNFLITLKGEISQVVWNAEYQQRPSEPEGNIFKINRINFVGQGGEGVLEPLPPEVGQLDEDGNLIALARHKNIRFVRSWDMAASEKKSQSTDPDYTVGTLMAALKTGQKSVAGTDLYIWYVLDVIRARMEPEQAGEMMLSTARLDGPHVQIVIEQEGGASGKTAIAAYKQLLAGFAMEGIPSTLQKAVRASPFAMQFNMGRVFVLSAPWNKVWLQEHAEFPNAAHDDQVDSGAQAFNALMEGETQWTRMKFKKV